jgi:hypothetical protein
MTSVSTPAAGTAGLRAMAAIEARRLARHPAFVVGNVLAFGILALVYLLDDDPALVDLLSIPVIPAFFIGLSSLIATARLTRSADVAVEAVATAPGSEARRTAALALACLVSFGAGTVFTATLLVLAAVKGVHPHEWWFTTMPDWQVWTILLALGPVACLGGALLGVLTGRWLRFPGAAAVVAVAVVALDIVGQMSVTYQDNAEVRLWVPWAMFHSGSEENGTQELLPGNPAFYLGYLLCLCVAAALVAIWHDRTARGPRLTGAIAATTVCGLACLALAVLTGPDTIRVSEVIPFQLEKS